MNEEELEKEAEGYAREWLYHVKDLELHHKEDDKPEYIRIKEAYIASAEPREKRIEELEKENLKVKQCCHKWFMRWREAKKDALYFDSSLQKQIEATLRLQKENAELKCECRRCVYTDSPCILSDYGKDRNGICDHFKDVFDENAELKAKVGLSIECEKAQKNGNLCLGYGGDEDEPL